MEKKIGILGGSFNPAHEGHIYISKKALKLMALDEVWWLVSPQNPLKSKEGMAPFEKRFSYAKQIAPKKIIVSDFEKRVKNNFTYNTLKKIQERYPRYKFVWLMGVDNLEHFHLWHKWKEIFDIIPIAVFERKDQFRRYPALQTKAARKFMRFKTRAAKNLAYRQPPAWNYFPIKSHPASATKIRGNKSDDDVNISF